MCQAGAKGRFFLFLLCQRQNFVYILFFSIYMLYIVFCEILTIIYYSYCICYLPQWSIYSQLL